MNQIMSSKCKILVEEIFLPLLRRAEVDLRSHGPTPFSMNVNRIQIEIIFCYVHENLFKRAEYKKINFITIRGGQIKQK